jgi:hypothetical protein
LGVNERCITTLSWARLERDVEGEGGVKSPFPMEVIWESAGGAEGARSQEYHDAEIVCFQETGRVYLIQFDAAHSSMVATREGENSVRQCSPVGIPAQVVDMMAPREPCADLTREASSWPTVFAGCRTRSYKLSCIVVRTGWVERKLAARNCY